MGYIFNYLIKCCIIFLFIKFLIIKGKYRTTNVFNIHIIPHSHMDPGWVYTADKYYKLNISLSFNNILKYLTPENNRTFVICEMIYFIRWYNTELNEDSKNKIKNLINQKRIEFVLGGYIMNDQATPLYQDIMEQLRYGLQFLYEEFNYTTKTAWYLDSFGLSSGNTHILSSLDYNFLITERIFYEEIKRMKKDKKIEFYWKGFSNENTGRKIMLRSYLNLIKCET